MDSKKKDLEIIYRLQWKNKPATGSDNKLATIVGMYDIPATTLNWETFKSYLLKNSGTAGDDVKVSYVINDREYTIDSQIDFQIALYSFRNHARMGEIINLRLDRISDQTKMKRGKSSGQVNAQTQVDAEKPNQDVSLNADSPPDWFRLYMRQFKKEIVDEVNASMMSIVTKQNGNGNQHHRKAKSDSTKRSRKHLLHIVEPGNEKDLLKSLKLERKLENKLEKLEHKTMKIREKKMAFSELCDLARHKKRPPVEVPLIVDADSEMDAALVTPSDIPHMLGGETYLHQWEIVNNGSKAWDSNTNLRYSWGSQLLAPVDKIVECPKLEPGQKGTISVLLKIPTTPGHYECYWHFYHSNRRFGHWLGCQVIVDDLPNNPRTSTSQEIKKTVLVPEKSKIVTGEENCSIPLIVDKETLATEQFDDALDKIVNTSHPLIKKESMENVHQKFVKLKIETRAEFNCSSDSDNQSIVSLADSNSSGSFAAVDEFVLLPMPNYLNVEQGQSDNKPNNVEETANNIVLDGCEVVENKESDDNNNNTENIDADNSSKSEDVAIKNSSSESSISKIQESPIEEKCVNQASGISEDKKSDYAYIIYEGQKLPVPKKFLHADYLATAEDAPEPKKEPATINESVVDSPKEPRHFILNEEKYNDPPQENGKLNQSMYTANDTSYASHCSAAGSCFSDVNNTTDAAMSASRLFVFPQNCPGFEVVYPPNENAVVYVKACPKEEKLADQSSSNTTGTCSPNSCCSMSHCAHTVGNVYHPTCDVYSALRNTVRGDENFVCAGSPPPQAQHEFKPHITQIGYGSVTKTECDYGRQTTSPSFQGCKMDSKASVKSEMTSPHVEHDPQHTVHILPETLVSGAVNVASSAINTARSVLNMIVTPKQEPGRWVNGHWITSSLETPRERNLRVLAEMGFWDRDLNATLLARYNDDLARVITDLVK